MSQETSLKRAAAGSGRSVDFTGTWVNELGSRAILKQTHSALGGVYESAVSSDGSSTKGDLTGHVDGDLISFVVHWRDFQAITAWVGQLTPSGSELKTLWQMTKQVDAQEEWSSINAGADVFHLKP